MTEQERKKAFENQRRNAERRAKEADGTYDMERRIQYEKKQREERRLQQQRQALRQRVTAAVIVVAALIVIAVLFRSCNKKDDKPFQTMPVQTSQEEITSGQIEEANEPEVKATVPTAQEQIQETNQLETVGETEQVQLTQSQPAESVAATVNAVDTAQHVIDPSGIVIPDWITVDLIHINNVSRPAIALDAVNDIAINCYRAIEILTGTAVTQSYLTITANRNTLPQLSVLQMSAKVIHNIFTQGILIFLVEFIPLHVNIIICQIKSIKDITLACAIKYWCRNIKSKCF